MTSLRCTALLACLLAGCGARSSLPAESQEGAPTGPGTETQRFDCRVSQSPRPMLAARVGSSVHFAYPDRSTKQVFTFDVPEGMYVSRADVIARGDHVAAYVLVIPSGGAPEPQAFAEVAVLHVDGSVLFHERHDFAYEGVGSEHQLTGRADLFVLTLTEVDTSLGLVIDGAGSKPISEPLAARSDPGEDGHMVMWKSPSNTTADLHFFDTAAGTVTPSLYISADPFEDLASSPAVLGSGLLYLQRDPARLVYETASGTTEQPLDVSLESPGYATPGYMYSGGYVLFMLGGTTPLDARYLATRFAAGEAREFSLSPPAGLQLPGDYWNPPPIDSRGRLLVPLYGDEKIQLFATSDGAAWEPVGRPIAEGGYPITTAESAGTVIFAGFGGGEEVPGALPPWADQLIGPEGGEGIELVRTDPGAPDNPLYGEDEISADGACVAYFRSGSIHVIEVAGYSSSDLGISTDGQSAEMAWIPLAE